MAPSMLVPAVLSPLMALAVWRRLRTQFGHQPVRRGRLTARLVMLCLIVALISLPGLASLRLLEGLAGGLLGGAALGLLGLRLTRFERGADGTDRYLPNPWVGGAVTLLLLGRLAWRFLVALPAIDPSAGGIAAGAPLGSSPLTLLVFGLMFGYYIAYCAGLLVHHRRFERAQALR